MFKRRANIFFLVSAIAVIIYVIIRAVNVDVTNDEAYSFYIMKNFWYVEALCTGNTHWLNSAAIKLSMLSGIESEPGIRWLSVLSAITFYGIILLFVTELKHFHSKLFLFALLGLNPYLIDYFGLARGYAPGLMFEAAAIFCFIKSEKNTSGRFLSLIFAALSVFSNFSFIYFFIPFCVLYFIPVYKQLKSLSLFRDVAIVGAVLGLTFRAYLFMSRCSNDVIGAGTYFFPEFPEIFISGFFNGNSFHSGGTAIFSVILFVALLIVCGCGVFMRDEKKHPALFYCGILLSIMFLLVFINYLCFDLPFPAFRSAIFLIPVAFITLVYFVDEILKPYLLQRLFIFSIVCIIFVLFLKSMNLTSVADFRAQSNAKETFNYLKEQNATNVALDRGVYGSFRNYYNESKKFEYNFKAVRILSLEEKKSSRSADEFPACEYVVVLPPYDLSACKAQHLKFKGVKYFPESGLVILKKIN